jgi:bifunctional DNA-binding transcriptional regulator/antitoxin component of YhaV-PrlF toxin-antitoxin module
VPVKFEVSVMQVGSSLRITIPQELAKHLNIDKGDAVELWAENHRIMIEKKGLVFSAIWAFAEDILKLRKSYFKNVKAHASQPLGIPLHRFKGTIRLEGDSILLKGIESESNEAFTFLFSIEDVKDVNLGWDNTLRRWKDTRAWIRPVRMKLKDESKEKTLYVYSKKEEGTVYGAENKNLYKLLRRGQTMKESIAKDNST